MDEKPGWKAIKSLACSSNEVQIRIPIIGKIQGLDEETDRERDRKRGEKHILIPSYRYTFAGFGHLLSLSYLSSPPSYLLPVMETPGAGTHQTSLGERVPKFAAKAQGLLLSAPSVYFLASNQHPVLTTSLLFAF